MSTSFATTKALKELSMSGGMQKWKSLPKHKNKSLTMDKDVAIMKYLFFSDRQNKDLGRTGMTKADFKYFFGQDYSSSGPAFELRQRFERSTTAGETDMILEDMFGVLDRECKGYVDVETVVQFMFKNETQAKQDRMRKTIANLAGKRFAVQEDKTELPELPEDKRLELEAMFKSIGGDDGRMTEEQLKEAIALYFAENLGQEEVHQLFLDADRKRRGYVTLSDFIHWMQEVVFVRFEHVTKGAVDEYKPPFDPDAVPVHPGRRMIGSRLSQIRRANQERRTSSASIPSTMSSEKTFDSTMISKAASAADPTEPDTLDAFMQRPQWRAPTGGRRMHGLPGEGDVPIVPLPPIPAETGLTWFEAGHAEGITKGAWRRCLKEVKEEDVRDQREPVLSTGRRKGMLDWGSLGIVGPGKRLQLLGL